MAEVVPLKLNASNEVARLVSGDVVAPESLASGTADTTTFLRGDSAWVGVTAENLTSTGADIPGETEHGLFESDTDDAAGKTHSLYGLAGTLGLRARLVGSSVRIERRPTLYAPAARRPLTRYKAVRFAGRKTAGAALYAYITDNHEVSESGRHGYPYQVWTATDTRGLPHNRHKRIVDTTVDDYDSDVIGYEYGHEVYPGDFKRGRRMVWDLVGAAQCVGSPTCFWDFCLDLNPSCSSGAYATTNRMRLLSPELGVTWAGEATWRGRIELIAIDSTTCAYFGEFKIYDSTGSLLRSWDIGATSTHSFNWLTNGGTPTAPTKVQLRWRVDNGLSARVDTFDDTNQGDTNQGANLMRIHIDNYSLRFEGFDEGA